MVILLSHKHFSPSIFLCNAAKCCGSVLADDRRGQDGKETAAELQQDEPG